MWLHVDKWILKKDRNEKYETFFGIAAVLPAEGWEQAP